MRTALALTLSVLVACSTAAEDSARAAPRDTVVVFAAASLAGPMRVALDSFARRTGAVVTEEHGGSLELARRITELKRIPDVIALADQEVFPQLLVPAHTSWYARFARNRMVIAYTESSRDAAEMDVNGWWKVLLRPEVRVGRTDPELAPAGYRTLIMYKLAESHYQQPGLAARLAERTPAALMRGNAAELAALLEAGELDYIVEYESLARSHDFHFVALPAAIDLGDAREAADYARATVRVRRGADSVTIAGAPILYAASVPTHAPHRDAGARFLAFLLGSEGRALLRRGNVDALEMPDAVGKGIPAVVSATLRQ